jgi:hypothetical protein
MSKEKAQQNNHLLDTGYKKAIEQMRACLTEHGFLASTIERTNYRRVWGRDGSIMSIAALLSGQEDLIEGARHTLETLAAYQGPHGEIPSNVDPYTGRTSYGGMAGRVDADLWFVIACGQFWRHTHDERFLDKMINPLESVHFLLGAWEFNNRGLLYIPLTGDWADEYIHNGYVLYDQVLHLQAKRELMDIYTCWYNSEDHQLRSSMNRLKHLIQANYWFSDGDEIPDDVYHEILYKKGKHAAKRCKNRYWASFFSPSGYGYRFDAFSNALVSLVGASNEQRDQSVDQYIAEEIEEDHDHIKLLPAFHPVITPKDDDWEELQMSFSYSFKNKPYEYHNGGLWPMVTGFYVADLASRGKTEKAAEYLVGIHKANAMEVDGKAWSFPEYIHGKELKPGGMHYLGWSAAGAVIGQQVLSGRPLFSSEC